MFFKDVIGQSAIKMQLTDLVRQNRLSHALLFLSPEGSGALPLALAFAQYIVCDRVNSRSSAANLFDANTESTLPNSELLFDSCGVCSSCIKAKQLVHPDIHYSYPVIPKKPGDKPVSANFISEWREFIGQYPYGNVYDWLQFIGAENKQGNITAVECNAIIQELNMKSFESGYKILLMWMPEYLGNEGNKLLKLIEEPPPDTLFIFIAENESLILPTILSRLQLIKIPSIDVADIANALEVRANLPVNQARQVASISDGNYREALQSLNHSDDDWESLLREWLNAILKTGPAAQVKWIDEISKLGRERQKQFLRYFNHLLEQAVRLSFLTAADLPEVEKDFAVRLNKIAGIAQQRAIIEELDRAAYFIERNAHPRMLFHALTIKLYHIIAHQTTVKVL